MRQKKGLTAEEIIVFQRELSGNESKGSDLSENEESEIITYENKDSLDSEVKIFVKCFPKITKK